MTYRKSVFTVCINLNYFLAKSDKVISKVNFYYVLKYYILRKIDQATYFKYTKKFDILVANWSYRRG